jgi:FAD/FMN-containing dehydrogenase/Fe-S oxidoreductase
MDPERSRIQADLSGVLDGDIRCDDNFLQLYSSDASIYEVKPLGVVRPTRVEDVVACVNYARENDISLIPRGAGSNVSGGVVGNGLILDFSYAMRSVKSLGRDEVTVEPGLVLRRLNQQLTPHRQHFGPDPATRSVTTMGGVLSNNSTGSRWNQYGSPRDRVSRLQMVLASGDVIELNSATKAVASTQPSSKVENTTTDHLNHQVSEIVKRNADLISQNRPQTRINQAGYNVFDLQSGIGGQTIDLTRLIVGSEGTLGIITEATLQTVALPTHRGVGLLFFERVADAAEAALEIDAMQPAACDMVDRRLLSIARQKDTRYQSILPVEAESMLLVEFQTADEKTLKEKLETLVSVIQRKKNLAFDVRTTTDPAERDFFWHLVRRIVPIQYRLGGQRRAIPFVEDIAIAPSKLPEFLSDLYGILNRHEVTASVFAHMPQGHLHVRPLINMADPNELPKMQRVATELFDRVAEAKGTISGGQGDGLSRTWYLRKQYGRLYSVFAEIKRAFDPQNILNPGKVIDHPFHGLTDNVRQVTVAASLQKRSATQDSSNPATRQDDTPNPEDRTAAGKTRKRKPVALPVVEPQLAWQLEDIATAAQACNGCARCRTRSKNERMCPMFRTNPKEEASPRAKANLIRAVVTGKLDPRSISSDAFREIADLCVNCHQCRLDCPAQVDIPKLMVEAKAQHFAVNGLRFSDWCLTRLDWLYGVAGRMPRITNRLLRDRVARWLLDRLIGIAEGRKLPPFATSSFMRLAHRKKLDRPSEETGTKVVYFVDAYANWNDVELAEAFVAVMRKNNIEVFVPPKQMVSGMSLISDGAIRRARKIAQSNVETLAECVRQGYRIVTTEPSAALALSHEYVGLLDDEDAALVAGKTIDATSFLLEMHQAGKLSTDFSPIDATIGYHLPCHQRALGPEVPAVKLLNLIPGLKVQMIDKGCSGMAGTFGLKRKNYVTSLRMGFSLIDAMREPTLMAGTTECSTCKIQMEQGTRTPTIHPIKFLALAYGLMPELEDLFDRRSGDLVTT